MKESEATDTRRFLTTVSSGELSDECEPVVRFFEGVATAESWQPGGELRAYVRQSTYFCLWVIGNAEQNASESSPMRLVAGLQLVRPDGRGAMPSHRVWPELGSGDVHHTAHIAMLAVDKEWRGKASGLFWLLTAQMWNHCVKEGIHDLWLEATPRTMRCYERLGWPLQVQGELREHWGEPCYPCSLSVREVAGALAERAVRSTVYRRILADMVAEGQDG